MPSRFQWAAALLLCYGTCFYVVLVPPPFSEPATHTPLRICLLGNAPNEGAAARVFGMWGARFAGAYYLWNTTRPVSGPLGFHFIPRGARPLTFAEGMHEALKFARSFQPPCDYFFTHDDDLYFSGSNATHIADALIRVLGAYRPLVASFPWEAGMRMFQNLREIANFWERSDVGPMIGFDNGVIVYHSSVVDFFIPYAPRGEGGFIGHWTLGAHFINLFVTLAFRNYSVCINSLRYRNTLNVDNLSNEERQDFVIDSTGLVNYRKGPRHAYEWPLNIAYKSFLSSGLKCIPRCRWGRDLTLEDVKNWRPAMSDDLGLMKIAQLVAVVFHLQHGALQNNILLAKFSESDMLALKRSSPYFLRINVFTFNRPTSFQRLWSSLRAAISLMNCKNCVTSIHVYQDYDPQNSTAWFAQRKLLKADLGMPFTSHFRSSQQGLRRAMLSSWSPRSDDEFCLFLEDDIEIAALALRYVDTLIRQYWFMPRVPSQELLGISLYRPWYSEVLEAPMAFSHPHPLVLYQFPSSWGQVFAARPWRAFLDWEAAQQGGFWIPNSFTNRWPPSSSWKKALLRWMVSFGATMLYPNMFQNFSLSTNHLERGTHDNLPPNSTAFRAMSKKFFVPLVPGTLWPVLSLPAYTAIPQYDAWGQSVAKVLAKTATGFDKCTVIMAVCLRIHSWKERILHFKSASFVGSFVIVWQNCVQNLTPPALSEIPKVPFSVRIVSKHNSLNNRFFPIENVSEDCVISVDDDFDMPLRNLSFAVETWRGHFWNQLVGFAGFGRNHFWEVASNAWRYSTSGREKFASMVLPTCMVYHRKYHAMYAALPADALRYVDATVNCDDILLNFLVSNATRLGPVLVAGDASPVYVHGADDAGLWHRTNHFSTRSECLNYFSKLFGYMPLQYTTTFFSLERSYGSVTGVPPGLRHFKSSESLPSEWQPSE